MKIHLLIWALQSNEREGLLLKSKNSNYKISIGIWNIDKKNYSLTENGNNLIKKIIDDQTTFIEEKQFLEKIGSSLTETNITKLQNLWIS